MDIVVVVPISAVQNDSMEELQVLSSPTPQKGFGTRVHQRVIALTGGVDLQTPVRSFPRVALMLPA
ncbi:hypothetical protein [Thiothrix winogradskyi]|uniref:Uncharacterized protein n=1 Tax=Thiothrix winogradskyi TaxID=96472 RepID=A0ABY3SXR9_9GAMM|nr:hypothetical protein [Thiothrix winogradskyi]UJS23684.1 hypothetical protein L2Y54_17340 [Thiothrix winogradskyi]